MTTSHKLTLFSLVMTQLTPYRERLQPHCELKIEYLSTGKGTDTIDVTVVRWGNDSHIIDHEWSTYRLDDPSECNINTFIDMTIEDIKLFTH